MGNVVVQVNDTWEWDGEFWTQQTQVLPPGKITRCASIALVRPRSCLAGGWETLRLATLGVGTGKTGRNLTILDRQPVGATLWSLTQRVAARCFLVEMR